MSGITKDVIYAIRMFRSNPWFTAVVLLTLALGIGANTIIFSVVNAIVLRPLPYREADRLAFVSQTTADVKIKPFSILDYYDWRDQNQVFSDLGAFRFDSFNLTGDAEPERLQAAMVTANIFPLLRTAPILGQSFSADDDKAGGNNVVVLSYSLWQRRFGGDENVLGKTMTLNGGIYSVVGVMPSDFVFPPSSSNRAELWLPLGLFVEARGWGTSRHARPAIYGVGRLKDGVTMEEANSEMNTIAARLEQQYPETNAGHRSYVLSLHRHIIRDVRASIIFLLGAVGLVLLIACANVANLLLSRAAARQREISIRSAMGASQGRLVRQLLTESILISLLGAVVGLGLAYLGLNFLVSVSPTNLPRVAEIGIDGRVLWFTLLISIITGLIFGLMPALHGSKADLSFALKEGARGSVSVSRKIIRNLLVVGEVAVALVLLVSSVLIVRGFLRLLDTNPGFDTRNVLTMRMALAENNYGEEWRRRAFSEQLVQRVKTISGVQSAAVVMPLPLSGDGAQTPFAIEGRGLLASNQVPLADLASVSPDYFDTLGIRLVQGRFFNEHDKEDSAQVAIIDETMAHRYWPNENPVGKRLKMGPAESNSPWIEIVGVVGHLKNYGVTEESRVEMFRPYPQVPFNTISLVVRTDKEPSAMASAVRNEIAGIDHQQPVYSVRTMDDLLSTTMAPRRLVVFVLAAFALLALLLKAIGVYSVMAYSVSERMHEIGIRMALGAERSNILKLIMSQGLKLVIIGLMIGLVFTVLFTSIAASLLFGLSPGDPVSYMSGLVILATVALLACYVPGIKATRVDPIIALREE